MTYQPTEADAIAAALDHGCPTCGAKAGVRCRFLTPNKTNPRRTKVDVRRKPCPERVSMAWRDLMNPKESKHRPMHGTGDPAS
jgi:hypothetical protein